MKQSLLLITTVLFIFSLGILAQQQTNDGGFIVIGCSQSYTNGSMDFLVYKLSATGAKQWRKNFGGNDLDMGQFIQQTSDGGYICCGYSHSYVHGSPAYADMLVYKLSATGQKHWRKNYGGDHHDEAYTVRQTSDGGYIVSGRTESYSNGGVDFLIYKVNAAGQKQWRKNYGGIHDDQGRDVVQTSDGGYVMIGDTESYTSGDKDFLVYKLNAAGQKQWRKNYGGINTDKGYNIQQTSDGGFVLCGYSHTYTHGGNDFLVYKVDATGAKLWRKNFGGVIDDYGLDIQQTSDGGYVVAGFAASYSNGLHDFLVYKVNSVGQKQWRKNYGGTDWDYGSYIIQTSDGGYFFFGETQSYVQGGASDFGDFLAYKLDTSGNKQWRKNYGGANFEKISRVWSILLDPRP